MKGQEVDSVLVDAFRKGENQWHCLKIYPGEVSFIISYLCFIFQGNRLGSLQQQP